MEKDSSFILLLKCLLLRFTNWCFNTALRIKKFWFGLVGTFSHLYSSHLFSAEQNQVVKPNITEWNWHSAVSCSFCGRLTCDLVLCEIVYLWFPMQPLIHELLHSASVFSGGFSDVYFQGVSNKKITSVLFFQSEIMDKQHSVITWVLLVLLKPTVSKQKSMNPAHGHF